MSGIDFPDPTRPIQPSEGNKPEQLNKRKDGPLKNNEEKTQAAGKEIFFQSKPSGDPIQPIGKITAPNDLSKIADNITRQTQDLLEHSPLYFFPLEEEPDFMVALFDFHRDAEAIRQFYSGKPELSPEQEGVKKRFEEFIEDVKLKAAIFAELKNEEDDGIFHRIAYVLDSVEASIAEGMDEFATRDEILDAVNLWFNSEASETLYFVNELNKLMNELQNTSQASSSFEESPLFYDSFSSDETLTSDENSIRDPSPPTNFEATTPKNIKRPEPNASNNRIDFEPVKIQPADLNSRTTSAFHRVKKPTEETK